MHSQNCSIIGLPCKYGLRVSISVLHLGCNNRECPELNELKREQVTFLQNKGEPFNKTQSAQIFACICALSPFNEVNGKSK